MSKNNFIKIILCGLILIQNSCSTYDSYYNKINNDIDIFTFVVNYISNNKMFEEKDSINKQEKNIFVTKNICLYNEDIRDTIILNFMNKFDIDRICLEKRNDNYYENVITFHKSYSSLFGKSKTIDFDFGKSPLRTRIQQGMKKDGGSSLKIINSYFIYSVNKNPSFGE